MTRFGLRALCFCALFALLYSGLVLLAWQCDRTEFSLRIQDEKQTRMQGENRFTTIILGDSRALAMNMDRKRAKAHSVHNFAITNAGGLYPYYYLLEQYLAHNPTPKVVILSFIPALLDQAEDLFREKVGEGAIYHSSSRLYSMKDILQRDSIFSRYPRVRRELIQRKLAVNKFYKKLMHPGDHSLFDPTSGFAIFEREGNWTFDASRLRPLQISQQAIDILGQFVATARRHQVKTVIYLMPIAQSMARSSTERQSIQSYQRAVARVAAAHPGWVEARTALVAYPDNLFIDGSHLNQRGADLFDRTEYRRLLEQVARLAGR